MRRLLVPVLLGVLCAGAFAAPAASAATVAFANTNMCTGCVAQVYSGYEWGARYVATASGTLSSMTFNTLAATSSTTGTLTVQLRSDTPTGTVLSTGTLAPATAAGSKSVTMTPGAIVAGQAYVITVSTTTAHGNHWNLTYAHAPGATYYTRYMNNAWSTSTSYQMGATAYVDGNAAPTAPGAPTTASPRRAGSLPLTWTASTDADGNPITYSVQRRSAAGATWSTVASSLTSASATLTETSGRWVYRVVASDGTTTTTGAESSTIVVDGAAPATLVAARRAADHTAGGVDWFKGSVTATWTTSGDPVLADGAAGSGVDTSSFSASTTTGTHGAFSVAQRVKDLAGNQSVATTFAGAVDTSSPTIGNAVQTFERGSSPTIAAACSDTGSGVASGHVGGSIDTSSITNPGEANADGSERADSIVRTVSVTCTDNVGHVTTQDVRYVVHRVAAAGDGEGNELLGSSNWDFQHGYGGNDVLEGRDGDDVAFGDDGDDHLDGKAGDDQLFGGRGNDRGFGESGNDLISGGDGDDYAIGHGGDDELRGGDGRDELFGEDGNDVLVAGAGDNTARGGRGDDVVTTLGGQDEVSGEDGHDTLDAGDGNDHVRGGGGNDTLLTGPGDDRGYGEDGDDVIADTAGRDELRGGSGNDTVDAGSGDDEVHGESGSDALLGGHGDDLVTGDSGADLLDGGSGADRLYSGSDADTITAGPGADDVKADSGDDAIDAADGETDRIECGSGTDTITADADDVLVDCEQATTSLGGGHHGAITALRMRGPGVPTRYADAVVPPAVDALAPVSVPASEPSPGAVAEQAVTEAAVTVATATTTATATIKTAATAKSKAKAKAKAKKKKAKAKKKRQAKRRTTRR